MKRDQYRSPLTGRDGHPHYFTAEGLEQRIRDLRFELLHKAMNFPILRIVFILCCWVMNKSRALQSSASTNRRAFGQKILSPLVTACVLTPVPCMLPLPKAFAFTEEDIRDITKLPTGVQYRDDHIGGGELVQSKNGDVVLMHVRGLLRDGSVFLDSEAAGAPLLHKLGTLVDFNFFRSSGDSSHRSLITVGLEDGISGMHTGGIRRIVVPGPLGYGHAGVSRYDAYRMGLRRPIPRDETLRYEVELLRCSPYANAGETQRTVDACCTDETFPCPTGDMP
jgi:hypothetical protein